MSEKIDEFIDDLFDRVMEEVHLFVLFEIIQVATRRLEQLLGVLAVGKTVFQVFMEMLLVHVRGLIKKWKNYDNFKVLLHQSPILVKNIT